MIRNLLRAGALALAALLCAPVIAATQLSSCINYQGQTGPCTGATIVDGAGVPVQGGARATSGTLVTVGAVSASVMLRGSWNLSFAVTGDIPPTAPANGNFVVGVIERSFDAGTTWFLVHTFNVGTLPDGKHYGTTDSGIYGNSAICQTATCSVSYNEPEAGVLYRVRATQIDSGVITYRMSQ